MKAIGKTRRRGGYLMKEFKPFESRLMDDFGRARPA